MIHYAIRSSPQLLKLYVFNFNLVIWNPNFDKLLIEYLIEILYNMKWVSLHVTFFNCCKLKAGSDILAPNILALNGIFISYEVRNYANI